MTKERRSEILTLTENQVITEITRIAKVVDRAAKNKTASYQHKYKLARILQTEYFTLEGALEINEGRDEEHLLTHPIQPMPPASE